MAKPNSEGYPAISATHLEEMEWLPSGKPGRTRNSCFKILGERARARDFEQQVAEFQVRIAPLNRFTELGTLAMP